MTGVELAQAGSSDMLSGFITAGTVLIS